jgi:phage portal protein BeeE
MGTNTRSIVQDYLNSTRFTLREFGEQFGVSHVTVIYWRDGKYAPDTDLMMQYRGMSDWRGAFAREILASKGIY